MLFVFILSTRKIRNYINFAANKLEFNQLNKHAKKAKN